ncbi:iron chelate uptake ABC transporter family permease subunit [Microbacterium sp. SORGH_AS_0888]|uniref:FecCD family ABC transporter permease n=1 Tax=Microbacterium sp. SORGH_AS_0888 TaxID=3041791 RepID=UPI00277E0434|nr:iron chelate uptake ABC transporter family permease subunit [Microbacterium sp. SORGH_AS_0888]MDQ1130650.1 iron complex transport system permease protein [Microbacterium sp. SORGH_AS_0888]
MSTPSRIDFGVGILTVRVGVLSAIARSRPLAAGCTFLVLAAAVSLLGLCLGDLMLGPDRVLSALLGTETGTATTVVRDWRLPRVLAALLFGAALGAAGAVFQSLTRNALASPDVIGLTSGAYAGGIGAIILFGGGFVATASGSLLGGLATTAAVYLLAWRNGVHGLRLIVVGIGMSAMLTALSTYLLLRARREVAMNAAVWGAGSLSDVTWATLVPAAVVIGVVAALLCALATPLRMLELGDDAARSLGVRPQAASAGLIVCAVALTASVVAVAGPIAFIALAAPQLARRIADTAGVGLASAAAMGALLLSVSDVVAQHALPVPLPVGVVTVVVGGAYLCGILIRQTRRRA